MGKTQKGGDDDRQKPASRGSVSQVPHRSYDSRILGELNKRTATSAMGLSICRIILLQTGCESINRGSLFHLRPQIHFVEIICEHYSP